MPSCGLRQIQVSNDVIRAFGGGEMIKCVMPHSDRVELKISVMEWRKPGQLPPGNELFNNLFQTHRIQVLLKHAGPVLICVERSEDSCPDDCSCKVDFDDENNPPDQVDQVLRQYHLGAEDLTEVAGQIREFLKEHTGWKEPA